MNNAASLKNIIFDLGGVLLNIDPMLTLEALEGKGVTNLNEMQQKLADSGLYQRFDSGKCSPECFRAEIRNACNHSLTDQMIDDAWNALLLDFPVERFNLLQDLRFNYRLFLLSNTNSIHYLSYTQSFYDAFGENFEDQFEKLFLSYEMGVHKPDAAAYQKALSLGNLEPGETLFIDDTLVNAEAGAEAGMVAFYLAKGVEVTSLFKNGKLRNDTEFIVAG